MAVVTVVGPIKELVEKRANSYIRLGYKVTKPIALKNKEYKIVLCKNKQS